MVSQVTASRAEAARVDAAYNAATVQALSLIAPIVTHSITIGQTQGQVLYTLANARIASASAVMTMSPEGNLGTPYWFSA